MHKIYKHTHTYLRSPPPGIIQRNTGVPEWDPPRRCSSKLNGSKFTYGESRWSFYRNSTRALQKHFQLGKPLAQLEQICNCQVCSEGHQRVVRQAALNM